MRLGSLCSGFGGLDLGLERAGFDIAWHVEPDAACSTVLDAHWPAVPNHGDIKTVDWSAVEPVDAICGGYPCQPLSKAGRRRGEDDPRHLWPYVLIAVRALRPRLVVLENVAAHLSLGFGRVLGDLAEAGYDAEWRCLRAADVGAPHGRERVFIVAAPNADSPRAGWLGGEVSRAERPNDGRSRLGPGDGRTAAPDPVCVEHERRRGSGEVGGPPPGGEGAQTERQRVRDAPSGGGAAVACRSRVSWGEYEPAIRRWEAVFGEPAPDPLDGRGLLNVELTRWMMGFPPGWHGDLPRTAALKGYGNAVQVQVAELVGRWAL